MRYVMFVVLLFPGGVLAAEPPAGLTSTMPSRSHAIFGAPSFAKPGER